MRTTTNGKNVCSFTVAVNRRKKVEGQPEADFFKVTAWEHRGEVCAKYLAKGKKVAVVGPVSVKTYQTQNGEYRASMEVTADDVEFLSSRQDNQGMQKVEDPDDPFIQDIPY